MINFWMEENRFPFYVDTFYGENVLFVQVINYKDHIEKCYELSDSHKYNFYKHPTLDKGPLLIKNFDGTININDIRIEIGFLIKGFPI